MREITNKTELAEFFRDELLPYYEQHYREDLTRAEAKRLSLNSGLCLCAKRKFKACIYGIVGEMTGCGYILAEIMCTGSTAKESLLPRIEWMRNFIKQNLPCSSLQTKG